jgi:hypothetical protein
LLIVDLSAQSVGATYDAAGRLVCGGLVETHIHLNRAHLLDRRPAQAGRNINPVPYASAIARSGEDLGDAVAAPDLGASKYARRIRKAIGSRYQIAIVDKERDNGATRPLGTGEGPPGHHVR